MLPTLFGAAFTLATAYALGNVFLRHRPAPPEIRLALGAAVESTIVFLLLLCHLAHWGAFLALGIVSIVAGWRFGSAQANSEPIRIPRPAWIVFAAYGIWYLVNALAPEIFADGITYHLGLPAEYLRLGGFPDRPTFYELIPQGMEMLYTVAFSFGRHAAAKLVEFAFFLGTVPLFFRIARRLGLPDLAALVAAIFYFCAPVAGLTGSSSYNDAAGVFFLLATFYLLLKSGTDGTFSNFANQNLPVSNTLPSDEPANSSVSTGSDPSGKLENVPSVPIFIPELLATGVLAGFCYAIKLPGAIVPVCAVLFVATQRRWRAALLIAAGAAVMIAPWMTRDLLLTGNPFAPLMNATFPNASMHIATERELAANLRSLGNIAPAQVPWELAFGDRLNGTFGPLLFALPLGLFALRSRSGRLLWAGALLLALPWLTNTGARFLMPSIAVAGLALGMVLPRPAAWAAIAIQAILCWPHVFDTWEKRYSFRLHEFPLAAALGTESKAAYLKRHVEEYSVAKMIEHATPPDSRTLALLTVANAYLDRDVAVSWQSAEADQLLDTLRLASVYSDSPTFDWRATWPEQPIRTLRFRMPAAYAGEWDINEVQLFSGDYRIFNSPQWILSGWPNHWEAPLAFDGNLATRWRTWETVRAGMYMDIEMGHPQRLSSAVLVTHIPVFRVSLEIYGRDAQDQWHLLSTAPQAVPRPPQDLRLEAARALRNAGYRYLLVPTGGGGNAPVGNLMVGHEAEWGMERAGYAGRYFLLRVK
jgi:hypothetical protein